ncbi:MAG: hypothetical protein ACK5LN_03880 [Propioniciclava sp.]
MTWWPTTPTDRSASGALANPTHKANNDDMDDYTPLLNQAQAWARGRGRAFEAEVAADALHLRDTHDGLAPNNWPEGSVRHLMLVRWPSHGPVEAPDVNALTESLDAYWSFLRSTGCMAGASAQPAALRKEAKKAAPRMAKACADKSLYGPVKQMLAFGSEIGIDLDNAVNIEELNARLQEVQDAWNAQPIDVRRARSGLPPLGDVGRDPEDWLDADDLDDWSNGDAPDLQLPDSPLFAYDAQGNLLLPEPWDREASARQAQDSGYVQSILELARWVGDGKEVTSTDTLRPAVGRQAYVDLRLRQWERDVAARRGIRLPPASDEPSAGTHRWRSASTCFALERLWRAALLVGLVTITGKTARFEPTAVPTEPEDWIRLGLMVTTQSLVSWGMDESVDLTIETLTALDIEHGSTATPDDITATWWASPANPWSAEDPDVADEELTEEDVQWLSQISTQMATDWLATHADHGLWTETRGRMRGTAFGRDALVIMVATLLQVEAQH